MTDTPSTPSSESMFPDSEEVVPGALESNTPTTQPPPENLEPGQAAASPAPNPPESQPLAMVSEPPPASPPPAAPPTPASKPDHRHRHRRGSVFFPLLLIVLGGALLLNNLGIISGSAWGTLLSLWPVIFIAWGLDTIWRGEGITGAIFLLGLGTVFLLANYGYLQLNPWQVLLTIWPVLLVAIGFDILIGHRRTWWTSLLGVFLVVGLMVGALWFAGVGLPGSQMAYGEKIEFGLQGATSAQVQILPAVGSLSLDRLNNSDALLAGTVPSSSANYKVTQEFTKVGDVAKLKLQSSGLQVFYPSNRQNQYVWDLGLTPSVPVGIQVDLGAGDSTLDLSGLQISDLNFNMGLGSTSITLPETGHFIAKIDGAIGSITIYVPAGMTVQLKTDTALTARSLPAGYEKQNDNMYLSPGYSTSANQVVLDVGLAIGQVSIVQK